MSAAESPGSGAADRLDDLYRRHAGEVYRYAYAVLGNRADAEDVTQTTFVNALRALERGERPVKPANWLLVIAHNLVRQRWRHAACRPAEVELVADVAALERDESAPRLEDLVQALQRIPPAQREALVMRELEGRSYAEIAEILGHTTSALETLLFRARRSLADELENLVTCERAELDLNRGLDHRLSRKERRRLDEHLAACQVCARRAATYSRQRRTFAGLAALPLPLGMTIPYGAPAAATGTGLALVGAGTAAVTGTGAGLGGGAAATAAGASGAGLFGATLAKVAAVAVAATIATGAGVKGAELARDTGDRPSGPTASNPAGTRPASDRAAPAGPATARAAGADAAKVGKLRGAPGRGSSKSTSVTGHNPTSRPVLATGGGQANGNRPEASRPVTKPSKPDPAAAPGGGGAQGKATSPEPRGTPHTAAETGEPTTGGKTSKTPPSQNSAPPSTATSDSPAETGSGQKTDKHQ